MTTAPQAVLWDLDGTLIDTEPLWIAAEHELVAAHGGRWTHEDALALIGNPLSVSAPVLQAAGVDLPAGEIVEWLVDRVQEQLLANGPTWRPGALELLAQGRAAGIGQAIVTMSYRRQAVAVADAVAAIVGPGTISVIVAGDEVTRGKPDPECYLTAAAALGVAPRDALAIEDSASGSRAALASGAATVLCECMLAVPDAPGLARVATLAGATLPGLFTLGVTARSGAAEANG